MEDRRTPRLLDLSEVKCPICENIDCLSFQTLTIRDRRNRIRRMKCRICQTKSMPRKPEKRKCLGCRKPFETFKEDQRHCHPRCRVRSYRKRVKDEQAFVLSIMRRDIAKEGEVLRQDLSTSGQSDETIQPDIRRETDPGDDD